MTRLHNHLVVSTILLQVRAHLNSAALDDSIILISIFRRSFMQHQTWNLFISGHGSHILVPVLVFVLSRVSKVTLPLVICNVADTIIAAFAMFSNSKRFLELLFFFSECAPHILLFGDAGRLLIGVVAPLINYVVVCCWSGFNDGTKCPVALPHHRLSQSPPEVMCYTTAQKL